MTRAVDILEAVSARTESALDFLEGLARIETPSTDPASHSPLLDLVAGRLDGIGFHTTRTGRRGRLRHLYARPERRSPHARYQLLLGHIDTVWPTGTLGSMPVVRKNGLVAGPGVFDMKAGIVQMIVALEVLHDSGHRPVVDPVVFLNADEEVGSHDSTRYISRLARGADRAFVLEPAFGEHGYLKTRRKGVGRFTLHIHGRPAHAGLDPGSGASAIVELARVVSRLEALNDHDRGITVNVGLIDGGTRPNVVAPYGRAVVDVRAPDQVTADELERVLFGMTAETDGTTLTIEGGFGRPPLEATPRNQALTRIAFDRAQELGIDLGETFSGGGSDGCTTSRWTATLDGMGAVGLGAHSPSERIHTQHFAARTALLAVLLLEPELERASAGRTPWRVRSARTGPAERNRSRNGGSGGSSS